MKDSPNRTVLVTFEARRQIYRVALTEEEWVEFRSDPVIRSVDKEAVYCGDMTDLDHLKEWIEEYMVEYMTPNRVELMEEIGYDLEDISGSQRKIRDEAYGRGVSYGHGNALWAILERKAKEAAQTNE